jgi:hypothetical protein
MFCHCLNRNWQGNPELTVVLGKKTDMDQVNTIIAQQFDCRWQIKVLESQAPSMPGSVEQQVNKMVGSIQSNSDDVIVFDSKDFLLKPANISTFKRNDQYRVTYRLTGRRLVDMNYDITNIVDEPVDRLPAVSNLTPWIWNRVLLDQLWTHLHQRHGHHCNWNDFPAGNEIYAYYVWIWTRPERPLKFLTHPDMPMLVAGGWTHQTLAGILEQAKDFDNDAHRIIWKHSRKLSEPGCQDVTKSVLIRYGIDKAFVEQIYG